MNTTAAIGIAFFGACLLYLLVRIAHDLHTDRQAAKFIKERDAALDAQPAAPAVAEVTNKYGDPVAFAEHELTFKDADIQRLPIGTKLYAVVPTPPEGPQP